jgi:NAD(P)-dependent dehydrogenase (short-subunit alcohol dehydrogenase family)
MSPRPVVVVTGANSDIGRGSVRALLGLDAHVVATVRSDRAEQDVRDDLDGHLQGRLEVVRLDVTDADAAAELIARHRPDVVVNNAGAALLGAVRDVSDEDALEQLRTMLVAPVRLARLASVHQEAQGHGRVVMVSSVLADTLIPFTGWYGAAKAGLDSITDTLRLELAPAGIEVVTVQCGAVATSAWDEAGAEVMAGGDELTTDSRQRWSELTARARPLFEHPDEVGAVVAEAALAPRPKPTYRVGFGSHLGLLSSVVPQRLEDAALRLLMGLRRP